MSQLRNKGSITELGVTYMRINAQLVDYAPTLGTFESLIGNDGQGTGNAEETAFYTEPAVREGALVQGQSGRTLGATHVTQLVNVIG